MNECLMKEEMVSVANTAEASVIEEWKGQVNVVSGKLWLIFVRLLPYGKVVRAGTELRSILKVEAMGVNADLYEEGRWQTA